MESAQGQIVIVGVTGASGAVLAQTALRMLPGRCARRPRSSGRHRNGPAPARTRTSISPRLSAELPGRILDSAGAQPGKIRNPAQRDVGASIASGSYPADAMCVIPCSMGMLSAIAAGASNDLVSRAADVSLKEGRRLVLCVRDTPFSRIHLENMLRAQQAGAVIMPAIPSFYHQPKTIDDLVTQYVCRVLGANGVAAGPTIRLERPKQPSRARHSAIGARSRIPL